MSWPLTQMAAPGAGVASDGPSEAGTNCWAGALNPSVGALKRDCSAGEYNAPLGVGLTGYAAPCPPIGAIDGGAAEGGAAGGGAKGIMFGA